MDPALAKEIAVLSQHRALCEAVRAGDSEIQQYYNEATLFITGGSGFMGKQLIEKLFRTCDIKKVFLLMRAKKKRMFYERLDHILKDPVFDLVKSQKPDFAQRICPVEGNVSLPKLGMTDEDWNTIVEEVDIILHCAATVSFDEPIRIAALTNLKGTVEALNLGKACKKLRSFVHVSTAFSHATKSRINKEVLEKFYEAPIQPKLMLELIESVDTTRLEKVTESLIHDWPNTYTFTKAIAEEAVREASSELPVCIVRPAIVISSNREPSPGWLDTSCAFGPSGLVLGGGIGVMHAMLVDNNIKIDLVPVDLVNNAIIAAGWANDKEKRNGTTEPMIYTVTSTRNHIYMGNVIKDLTGKVMSNYPTPKQVWYSFVTETSNIYYYQLLALIWHYIPAFFIDIVLYIIGKKPMFVDLYRKADKLSFVLSYFTCNEWKSSDSNLLGLYNNLNATDQMLFNFDLKSVDWSEQIVLWALGCRKYIIKDGLQGSELALKKQFWLRIAHYIFTVLYFYALYKLFTITFSIGYQAVSYVMEF